MHRQCTAGGPSYELGPQAKLYDRKQAGGRQGGGTGRGTGSTEARGTFWAVGTCCMLVETRRTVQLQWVRLRKVENTLINLIWEVKIT